MKNGTKRVVAHAAEAFGIVLVGTLIILWLIAGSASFFGAQLRLLWPTSLVLIPGAVAAWGFVLINTLGVTLIFERRRVLGSTLIATSIPLSGVLFLIAFRVFIPQGVSF